MSFISLQRLSAIASAILLPATLHAALPTPAEAPERSFLTGQLLIASPSMGDPRFLQTVILMVASGWLVGRRREEELAVVQPQNECRMGRPLETLSST